MGKNLFSRSDTGAKAAWKGFSSQTTYIASRLIKLKEDFEFCPEQVEDLLIKKNGVAHEIVQVKNLSTPLSLSDLNPNEADSFFRRCLSYKDVNSNIVLKIISFGKVGPEIAGFSDVQSIEFKQISSKLNKSGYEEEDINWLGSHLSIEEVDEVELIDTIYSQLAETVETMVSPMIFLDVLTQYVANLSRHSDSTTKNLWYKKIRQISIELAAVRGFAKEFGNSILPMTEYEQTESLDKLKKEYAVGTNAQPQHIRLGLDITRDYWIDQIEKSFQNEKIVVIKGASGQGKSSLSYRYLYNYYSEKDIFCIQSVTNEEQAQNIAIALDGLAKEHSDIIVYYDISPQDTNWTWICEKLHEYGSGFRLLLSIREEDYRRANIDNSKTPIEYIDLRLSVKEAEIIFQRYENNEFRSFKEAWDAFGGTGPLMEFTYMLNQSQTLRKKLESQINRIITSEDYIEEWLVSLLVVSYAGKFSIDVDTKKLFSNINVKNRSKMIFLFEEEYLVKVSDNSRKINSLHALRASLICDILLEYLLVTEIDVIDLVMNSTNTNLFFLLVSYFYDNNINNELLNILSSVKYDSWKCYSSVIRALLWLELRKYYLENRATIFRIDNHYPGKFPIFLLGDVTTYYPQFESGELLEIMRESQPERVQVIETDLTILKSKKMKYDFIDKFMKNTIDNIPVCDINTSEELSAAGYGLFWLALRGIKIDESKVSLQDSILDNEEFLEPLLNFSVGIQKQSMMQIYQKIYPVLLEKIKIKYGIVYLVEDKNSYDVFCLMNIYDTEKAKIQYENSYIMSIVSSFRRLSIEKDQYNVKLIGDQIIDNLEIPEVIKTIKANNLPWLWVTEINGWLIKQHEYDMLPDNWNEANDNIKICMNQNIEIIKILERGLTHFYKKKNFSRLNMDELSSKVNSAMIYLNNSFLYYPKVSVDKFGVNNNRVIVDTNNSSMSKINESLRFSESTSNYQFSRAFSDYRIKLSSFYENMYKLLIERFNGGEISHQSKLSLINLVNSVDILYTAREIYKKEFQVSNELITTEDYNNLLVFVAIWSHLYESEFRIERNMRYERKEYLKRYRKRIFNFLENRILRYDGVIDLDASDNIIMNVEYSSLENIFKKLVDEFNYTFPEIDIFSFENILWKQSFKEIIVSPSFLGYKVPPSYKLLSEKFAYIDDIEKLMMTTKQTDEIKIDHPALASFFRYNSLQMDLRVYSIYSCQVNQFLENKRDHQGYDENIFGDWKIKVNKVICDDILSLIYDSALSVVSEINKDGNQELNGKISDLNTLVEGFKAKLDGLLVTSSIEKWIDLINQLHFLCSELTDMISFDLEELLVTSKKNRKLGNDEESL
ncbi:hypothetical protein [Enterococcus sp. 5H]|uniref:hypothetical protein n=1 Tax=Enterococcus sp. 5H TaxID=1229490 RepID=UPI0023031F28|nr:hypothetical protein [Enterococcus sp. 5H]MDA9472013.1 hypothetical protein [Enterococcus sp. 5H]